MRVCNETEASLVIFIENSKGKLLWGIIDL